MPLVTSRADAGATHIFYGYAAARDGVARRFCFAGNGACCAVCGLNHADPASPSLTRPAMVA